MAGGSTNRGRQRAVTVCHYITTWEWDGAPYPFAQVQRCSAMLYKSLPKSTANRKPCQFHLVLHTSCHICSRFDFLPFCFSTQLMASPPAWVIRAECINLVFIYSLWIHRGPTEFFLFLWQPTSSLQALFVRSAGPFHAHPLGVWREFCWRWLEPAMVNWDSISPESMPGASLFIAQRPPQKAPASKIPNGLS